MKPTSQWIALSLAAILPFPSALAQAPPALPVACAVDDTARFLAGMPPLADPALLELAAEGGWQRHAKACDNAWEQLEKRQLSKVRNWSASHIPDAASAKGTLFYMFSGPDFLYADTIFPQATTHVFCGIEPVGPVPDLTKLRRDQLGGELQSLRNSIDSVLSFSFFLTKEMKGDLQNHALRGTLPILAIFLARSGKTICDVSFVGLDKDGALLPLTEATRGPGITAPGVKITFLAAGSDTPRTLYYFSTDISDSGLKTTGFLQFCKSLAPGNSLVKSASYLMHESYFSSVRSFLLENTVTLVQDDSGIPCSFFPAEQWDLRLFGSYPGPIPLFKNKYQPRLTELYRASSPPPLDFGIGYRHRRGESTLMVATRRLISNNDEPPKAVPVAIPVDESSIVPAPMPPASAP